MLATYHIMLNLGATSALLCLISLDLLAWILIDTKGVIAELYAKNNKT